MSQIFYFPCFLGADWVDPEDPTVIAENELLSAASSIEAAAKKLSALKPRQAARVRNTVFYFLCVLCAHFLSEVVTSAVTVICLFPIKCLF